MKRAVEIIDRKKAEKEAAAQAKREEVSFFPYRIAVCLDEGSEHGSCTGACLWNSAPRLLSPSCALRNW
jgi:hypothetical protein